MPRFPWSMDHAGPSGECNILPACVLLRGFLTTQFTCHVDTIVIHSRPSRRPHIQEVDRCFHRDGESSIHLPTYEIWIHREAIWACKIGRMRGGCWSRMKGRGSDAALWYVREVINIPLKNTIYEAKRPANLSTVLYHSGDLSWQVYLSQSW